MGTRTELRLNAFAQMVWVTVDDRDYEHNANQPGTSAGKPGLPAGYDPLTGLAPVSGQPYDNGRLTQVQAEIAELEAKLAAGRSPVTRPYMPMTPSNVYVDPNVEPYEYTIQKECSGDRARLLSGK